MHPPLSAAAATAALFALGHPPGLISPPVHGGNGISPLASMSGLASDSLFPTQAPLSRDDGDDDGGDGDDDGGGGGALEGAAAAAGESDTKWYPPGNTGVNDHERALRGSGTYGFVFGPGDGVGAERGLYNWCDMPRVTAGQYEAPREDEFEIVYVEVIHRHHKRTPYAANSFPTEPYRWDCDDIALYAYGEPSAAAPDPASSSGSDSLSDSPSLSSPRAARPRRRGYSSATNPMPARGWVGTCRFPQITAGGLADSARHGADLFSVYGTTLGLIREGQAAFRITNNGITSEVAGMVVGAMFPAGASAANPSPHEFDALVQSPQVDGLEPSYHCGAARAATAEIMASDEWAGHLASALAIYSRLDAVSGVGPDDWDFHSWFDHYYDNLSARQCHGKPLPCSVTDPSRCVDQDLADAVYRLGNWEWSRLYRDAPQSLGASAAAMGVWISELADHLRAAGAAGAAAGAVRYRHNVAHDGSVARVLSVLQVESMFWPGMGAEVVFELWRGRADGRPWVRVLFGGRVLRSSSPALGVLDMVPLERLVGYFDALVGPGGSKVRGMCEGTIPLAG